jgi:hypothetical protein
MAWIKVTHRSNTSDQAFIGYKSKMRSCRVVRLGRDCLRCETTWRYRLVGIVVGLTIGLLLPIQVAREVLGSPPGGVPSMFLALAGIMTCVAWLIFFRSLLYSRAIEIDAKAGTIALVRRFCRRQSREELPMSQVSDVVVEKVVRLKQSDGSDNPQNRIDCWLLRVLLKDGRSRALCETSDQAPVEEMRSFVHSGRNLKATEDD